MKEFKQKYAVITGASSGIGAKISHELAKKGYSIVAVSNQTRLLVELKNDLEKEFDIEVLSIDYDLAKNDAAHHIFDYCQKKNIAIEILVNNAGILVYGEVVNIDLTKTESILNLHMTTPVLLCRLFGGIMAKNKSGYILNVSSISAVMAYPLISLYGPTKTFIRHFSKAFHIEMKRNNVNVTCLLPGATNTPLYDKDKVNLPLATRLGVMKEPEYVAKAGLKALFSNKRESIPGFINKLTVMLLPLFPTAFIRYIFKIYNKKTENKVSFRT